MSDTDTKEKLNMLTSNMLDAQLSVEVAWNTLEAAWDMLQEAQAKLAMALYEARTAIQGENGQ